MTCERCDRETTSRRYRCEICHRMVCGECCEAIDRTQGQRRAWCRARDHLGRSLAADCKEVRA